MDVDDIALGDLAHRHRHRVDRANDAAPDQKKQPANHEQRENDHHRHAAGLGPEDRVHVVEINSPADHPAKRLELDGIRSFLKRLAPRSTRKAIGYEASAGGSYFHLPAHEDDAVGIRRVVQIPAFDLRIGIGYRDAMRVESIEVIVFAEAEGAYQCLALLHGVGVGKPCATRGLILEVKRLTDQLYDVLKLGFAILHQIVPQRRQAHTGHRGNAQNGKADHHQKLVRNSEIAEH